MATETSQSLRRNLRSAGIVRNYLLTLEGENNAEAQTWKKQLRGLGSRIGLHGNELWPRSACGQERDDLSDPVSGRTRRHILRYWRSVRSMHERRPSG